MKLIEGGGDYHRYYHRDIPLFYCLYCRFLHHPYNGNSWLHRFGCANRQTDQRTALKHNFHKYKDNGRQIK